MVQQTNQNVFIHQLLPSAKSTKSNHDSLMVNCSSKQPCINLEYFTDRLFLLVYTLLFEQYPIFKELKIAANLLFISPGCP